MMRAINPAGQSIPQTSQAMLVSGDNLLFISGQVAYGAEGVIGTDLETQLNEAFRNLQTVLHEAARTADAMPTDVRSELDAVEKVAGRLSHKVFRGLLTLNQCLAAVCRPI
jgi:enamine deaminase RidA (YjgF/YER057c/UK114 family)